MTQTKLNPIYKNDHDNSRSFATEFQISPGETVQVLFLSGLSARDLALDYAALLSKSYGTYEADLHVFCLDDGFETRKALTALCRPGWFMTEGNPATAYLDQDRSNALPPYLFESNVVFTPGQMIVTDRGVNLQISRHEIEDNYYYGYSLCSSKGATLEVAHPEVQRAAQQNHVFALPPVEPAQSFIIL